MAGGGVPCREVVWDGESCAPWKNGGPRAIRRHTGNVCAAFIPLYLPRYSLLCAVLKEYYTSHAFILVLFHMHCLCFVLDRMASKLVCNWLLWIVVIMLHILHHSLAGESSAALWEETLSLLLNSVTSTLELHTILEKKKKNSKNLPLSKYYVGARWFLHNRLAVWQFAHTVQLQHLSYISNLRCAEKYGLCHAYSLDSGLLFLHGVNVSQED